MIGKLSGIIDSFEQDHLIIDVQGVGYVVFASRRTLTRIGQTGDPASLYIETVVREDAINLYGFVDTAEKDWFKILTGVQGVGAKVGLAILGVCPPEQLTVVIASQDKAMLTRSDGVGPKLATRILTELKDVAGKIALKEETSTVKSGNVTAAVTGTGGEGDISGDAASALINLGYGRSEAFTAVSQAKAKAGEEVNLQKLIRLALKEMSS